MELFPTAIILHSFMWFVHMCVCVCCIHMWCVHVSIGVCVLMEARAGPQMSSSIAFHITTLRQGFVVNWKLLVQLSYLVIHLSPLLKALRL